MKPLLAAAVLSAAIAIGGCAFGAPQPTTDVSTTSATLNGDLYSSFAGDTTYWFKYGETTAYGSETTHQTVAIADDQAHPVSEPISGLTPFTTYHFQLCAADEEEDPPRVNCSTDRTFTTGPSSTVVIFATQRDGNEEIYGMGPGGQSPFNMTNHPADDDEPDYFNDAVIAFTSNRSGNQDIFTLDLGSGITTQVTTYEGSDSRPAWSPDGTKIAFQSNRDHEAGEVYVMDADGANVTRVTDNLSFDGEPAWSPDGTKIAFTSDRDGGASDIYVMDADGDNATRLTDDAGADAEPSWSIDDHGIAFQSDRDGNSEIYTMDADGTDETNVTGDPRDDRNPDWASQYNRILFTRTGDDFSEVWVMDPDGSDQGGLTVPGTPEGDFEPTWGILI
jgi:hypothetical protein